MFKKLHTLIVETQALIRKCYAELVNEHSRTRHLINSLFNQQTLSFDEMRKTIDSQQRTIEQLTNALRDKYKHGLFVLSDDGTNFMVIKNGEEIANDRVAYCRVTWAPGEDVTIETEYCV